MAKQETVIEAALTANALAACRHYHTLYGSYPARIGIALEVLAGFTRHCVMFAELPRTAISVWAYASAEEARAALDVAPIQAIRHEVPFWPVAGPDVRADEVYLPDPRDPEHVLIPADRLARMVREWAE